MKFSQNGYDFTNEDNIVININKYCKSKKVKAEIFLVSKGEYKQLVIFDDRGKPVFESQKLEDICVRIDIMALTKQVK